MFVSSIDILFIPTNCPILFSSLFSFRFEKYTTSGKYAHQVTLTCKQCLKFFVYYVLWKLSISFIPKSWASQHVEFLFEVQNGNFPSHNPPFQSWWHWIHLDFGSSRLVLFLSHLQSLVTMLSTSRDIVAKISMQMQWIWREPLAKSPTNLVGNNLLMNVLQKSS